MLLRSIGFIRSAAMTTAILVSAGSASASVAWSTSAQTRSATATFSMDGSSLAVVLTNTSTADVVDPVGVLTAVFFDIGGSVGTLTATSATVTAGSTVYFGSTDPGNVVGGEWAWKGGLSGAPHGAHYGISSTGVNLFGPGDLFPGTNLQGPTSPDGLQYGITSAGDNMTTGNQAVTGGFALIKNQVRFVIAGFGSNFDLTRISNVSFQYGTDLAEPNDQATVTPTPGAASLLALGGLVLGRRRR